MEKIKEKLISGANLPFYFVWDSHIFYCANISPYSSSRGIVFRQTIKTIKITIDQKILNGVFFFLAFPLTVQGRIYGGDG